MSEEVKDAGKLIQKRWAESKALLQPVSCSPRTPGGHWSGPNLAVGARKEGAARRKNYGADSLADRVITEMKSKTKGT